MVYKYPIFFIDDLILFAKASLNQVKTIKTCLDVFFVPFRQRVSKEKSRVFFSRNMNHSYARDINSKLCFSITNDLGKYLGIPLHQKRITKATYAYLVEKVCHRL